jgi:hypothetical protein
MRSAVNWGRLRGRLRRISLKAPEADLTEQLRVNSTGSVAKWHESPRFGLRTREVASPGRCRQVVAGIGPPAAAASTGLRIAAKNAAIVGITAKHDQLHHTWP